MWNLKSIALSVAMLLSVSFSNPPTIFIDNSNTNTYNDSWTELTCNVLESNLKSTKNYVQYKKPKVRNKVRRSTLLTSRSSSKETFKYSCNLIPNSLQDSIYKYMVGKLKVPEAAFALAWHESGGFSSNLWRKGKNPFGMKATKSLNYDFVVWSVGDQHYKAGWNTWQQAVDNFASWEQRKNIEAATPEQYVLELRRIGYAADPYHGSKVLNYVKKIFTKEGATL